MTVVSGGIRLMRIFGEVPWEGALSDSEVVDNGNFQRFRWLFFSHTLDGQRYYMAIRIMQSVVGFSVIPKCMSLNDLDWLFRVKFCLRTGLAV